MQANILNLLKKISVVTASKDGLMSSSDKKKLDGITAGATKNTIENSLTSTSTTNGLSAAQGKALNDKITNLTPVSIYKNTTGNEGTITLSQSVNNFKYIEITFFSAFNNDFYTYKIPTDSNGVHTMLFYLEMINPISFNNDENSVYLFARRILVLDKTISTYLDSYGGVNIEYTQKYRENRCFIYEVKGYK